MDKVTNHYENGWTWDSSVFIFLLGLGFELVVIDEFDFEAFSRYGTDYLRTIWDEEEFSLQQLNADLESERLLARDLLILGSKRVSLINRRGDWADIQRLFNQGYLVVPNVNAYALDGEEGFCGHYVLVTYIDDSCVVFNDSGLPAVKDRCVDKRVFEASRLSNPSLFAVKK